ncbi:sigma-70 family RNA polymerase sigma factor [Paroceanicella profunda]|uniref:Sigma-70 family RNA polymerase sigma factor n=1 Tax=Paroceanicella profunda TaxID=2579971 RepID=A0A5B8FG79_9RHOB|nr:RNA polymerase sigma factor SigJ [Paroceanicella profunda]QDL90518.1 sigma-70 family RNA polymerase sigma factor [Paroceanicella profunda]
MPAPAARQLAAFEAARPRLIGVAYRMLGAMAEAEDAVQDAWLRWQAGDRSGVAVPEAWLVRATTRLCLDRLRAARARRETYPGPWLPEPVAAPPTEDPEEDISLALMLALERLSALERAAFLLHDVFGTPFEEVARTLGRDTAACRQLAARARRHVRAARPRFAVAEEEGLRIAHAFSEASRTGDATALGALLAGDVRFVSDGGGQRPAAPRPLEGAARVLRLLIGLARLSRDRTLPAPEFRFLNGLPGIVQVAADGEVQTTTLQVEEGRITGIYVMRNPGKLSRFRSAPQA